MHQVLEEKLLLMEASSGHAMETTLQKISTFQKDKLASYFKIVFDSEDKGSFSLADLDAICAKFISYVGASATSDFSRFVRDLFFSTYETICEKRSIKMGSAITLNDWLYTCFQFSKGAMGMQNFPYFVQLIPRLFFECINKSFTGVISKEELLDFYTNFLKCSEIWSDKRLEDLTIEAYNAMTAKEEYPLNLELYEQIFANFFLGNNSFGPGKWIFLCANLDKSTLSHADFNIWNDCFVYECTLISKPRSMKKRVSMHGVA